jgi:5-methylthioadenosine/S-adenosylhomocysteine deaminase
MDQQLGEIAAGKLADIALLRQDGMHVFPRYNPAANLVYSSRSADVDTVICNGKVLMRGKELLTIDKAEVKRQVNQQAAAPEPACSRKTDRHLPCLKKLIYQVHQT